MRPESSDWQTPAEPHVSTRHDGAMSSQKRAAHGGDADPEQVARSIALQRLGDQPRSRSELEQALAKRDVPSDVANRVLDRFEDVGLVDDEAFARSWVESRQRTRGLAGRALAQELRRKGVDDEVVRETVDDIDPDSERETARRLVRKKLPSLRKHDRDVRVRRLAGMLARKGYPSGLAYAVVKEELDVELDDPDL